MTDRKWADLRIRAASGVVLITLGAVETFLGGTAFLVAVVFFFSVMVWELLTMSASGEDRLRPLALAMFAALCLFVAGLAPVPWFWLLALPPLGIWASQGRDRLLIAAYGLAILLGGYGFVHLRGQGVGMFLWMLSLVIITDTMGYFVGRMLGGPKFWPRISPNKTWSGTVAGWLGALVVGVLFAALNVVPWIWAALSPLIALAGQMGDIAESWIKRRAGVKDSSRLIPGHGGVLDRFDALVGAVLAVQALGFVLGLG